MTGRRLGSSALVPYLPIIFWVTLGKSFSYFRT